MEKRPLQSLKVNLLKAIDPWTWPIYLTCHNKNERQLLTWTYLDDDASTNSSSNVNLSSHLAPLTTPWNDTRTGLDNIDKTT
ncbi:uncharacterized protein N7511_011029 [Penicillium nucicola]|uniref:uncharacterized protein n=1 Tax=Penicillium nucicola TaxID=1850975 RepID=UPI0025454254|nr:uncharacterized protein N7511_011029 [Penicillium nucicola]KAJ5749333.1 hypothetical protein N7511_011029 [Penicillium nucicola]